MTISVLLCIFFQNLFFNTKILEFAISDSARDFCTRCIIKHSRVSTDTFFRAQFILSGEHTTRMPQQRASSGPRELPASVGTWCLAWAGPDAPYCIVAVAVDLERMFLVFVFARAEPDLARRPVLARAPPVDPLHPLTRSMGWALTRGASSSCPSASALATAAHLFAFDMPVCLYRERYI